MSYSLGKEIIDNFVRTEREIIDNLGLEENSKKKMLFTSENINKITKGLEIKPGKIMACKGPNRACNTTKDIVEKEINKDYSICFVREYSEYLGGIESHKIFIMPNNNNFNIMNASIEMESCKELARLDNWYYYIVYMMIKDENGGIYTIAQNNYNSDDNYDNGEINYYDNESAKLARDPQTGFLMFKENNIKPSISIKIPESGIEGAIELVNGVLNDGPNYCANLIESKQKIKKKEL